MPHAYTEDQLVEQPAIGLFTELESFLAKTRTHVAPAREPTLFAIGGRGYYEDPTSDLLAFFINPDAEHGLQDRFVAALLECMKVDPRGLRLKQLHVEREVKTDDGKFIDIQITGPDWCLLIENKIRHWEANPFISYEKHAAGLNRRTTLFCVLSPSGSVKNEGKTEDWRGVSYKGYLSVLRAKMPELSCYPPLSKWHLFANEFIQHLDNELYHLPMKPDQITFVERHADQIRGIQNLATEYESHMSRELTRRLEERLPGLRFNVVPEQWKAHAFVFRISSPQWGETDMATFKPDGSEGIYFIRTYFQDLSEPRLSRAKKRFADMRFDIEEMYPFWTSNSGYASGESAISAICELANEVNELLKA
jgi:hypothetical protein